MDVYSQKQQRAHDSGFVGIEADSDDTIDNLEVYEALINPREANGQGGGAGGGPMMMPPMMGMGGAGGGGAAAQAGMNQSMASAAAAGAAARMNTAAVPTAAPALQTNAAAGLASPGVGSPSLGGLGGGGGAPIASPLAAGAAPVEEPAEEEQPEEEATLEEAPVEAGTGSAIIDGSGRIDQGGTPPVDVIVIDPAQVEQVAREWSGLSSQMQDVSKIATDLQAGLEDFGMVNQPAGPYGQMATGIKDLAGGAAQEFEEIAAGLAHGAQQYREQEAAATQTMRSAQ